MVVPDGDDHQVAMVRQRPESGVFDAFVCRDCDDRAGIVGDDDSAIEAGFALAVAPREEAVEDLRHLVEPARSRLAEVECAETCFVSAGRVAKNQRLARSIGSVVPFGIQRVAFESGTRAVRRPLARLRRVG